MALRKSNTHLWPFPVGVHSFDVQRDGLHPAACRREHKETERPSANPTGPGHYDVLHPKTPALLPEAAWIQEEVPVKPFGMFRKAPLTIGNRGQLQHCVKGTFQVGHFICRESKAGGLSHALSKSRLRRRLQQLTLAHTEDMHAPGLTLSHLLRALAIIPPPAGSILFPGTASSPALLSRKYASRQRMTAW